MSTNYDQDPNFEKEGSLNNPMVGLTGWAVQGDAADLRSADIWFVHPFGNDFQFYVVPDPQYQGLCSGSNRGINPINGGVDAEYNEATAVAGARPVQSGRVTQTERARTDRTQGRARCGDRQPARAAVVPESGRRRGAGRGVRTVDRRLRSRRLPHRDPSAASDGGGDGMPPPAGRPPGSGKVTQVQIMSRPYTVSQLFDGGTTNFAQHLAVEIAKVEDTTFGIPHSFRVEAHPNIITPPYDGRPYIKLLVQPPPFKQIGPIARPKNLMVSFHFTHREGVVAQVFDAGNGTVGIIIVLGDMNPAELPRNAGQNVEWSQLQTLEEAIYVALEIVDILTLKVASAIILALGIETDLYEPPIAASPLDNQNIAATRDDRPVAGRSRGLRGRRSAVPDLRLDQRLVGTDHCAADPGSRSDCPCRHRQAGWRIEDARDQEKRGDIGREAQDENREDDDLRPVSRLAMALQPARLHQAMAGESPRQDGRSGRA